MLSSHAQAIAHSSANAKSVQYGGALTSADETKATTPSAVVNIHCSLSFFSISAFFLGLSISSSRILSSEFVLYISNHPTATQTKDNHLKSIRPTAGRSLRYLLAFCITLLFGTFNISSNTFTIFEAFGEFFRDSIVAFQVLRSAFNWFGRIAIESSLPESLHAFRASLDRLTTHLSRYLIVFLINLEESVIAPAAF